VTGADLLRWAGIVILLLILIVALPVLIVGTSRLHDDHADEFDLTGSGDSGGTA
jgi:uncharacterized membrane protein YhaH (DUF805 family)